MRILILLLLLVGSAIEYHKWRPARHAWAWYGAISVFAGLRFGQGTDYFAYFYYYTQRAPGYVSHIERIDPGFGFLMKLAQGIGLSYYAFVFLLAALTMWLLYRFISCFSPFMRLFPLFLFYAIYALPYMESGLRQCLSMMLFLGMTLNCKWKGLYIAAAAIILAAMSIHASASILLFVLLLPRNRQFYERLFSQRGAMLLGGLIVCVILANTIPASRLLALLPEPLGSRVAPYLKQDSFSPLALLNRLLFMGIIYLYGWKNRRLLDDKTYFLLVLYTLGLFIYLLVMRYSVMSRVTAYFRIVEIGLLPMLLYYNKPLRPHSMRLGVCALAVLSCFLFWKDMQAFQIQGQYYITDGISYPYITLWNRPALLRHSSGYTYKIYSKTIDPHGTLLK